jgi:hypothetical protein
MMPSVGVDDRLLVGDAQAFCRSLCRDVLLRWTKLVDLVLSSERGGVGYKIQDRKSWLPW